MNIMKEILQSMKKRFPRQWDISSNAEDGICIRDTGIEKGRGFLVEIVPDLSNYTVKITFESFASDLVNYANTQLQNPESSLRRILTKNGKLVCRIYRQYVETNFDSASLSADGWYLTVQFPAIISGAEQEGFIGLVFSLIIMLFPYSVESKEEGHSVERTSEYYERSETNRAICLAYHGYNCAACDESLADKYGAVANEYIHVHHLNPVSESGVVKPDPIKDMIPLCPNCHGIAHLRNPPYTPTEIRAMLKKNL
jgi:hypothetical protein